MTPEREIAGLQKEIERLKAENALLKEQLKAAILNLARVAIEGRRTKHE